MAMTLAIVQPVLNDREWRLVAELLHEEMRELPVEIRHTDSPRVHNDLHERMKLVSELLRKVDPSPGQPGDQPDI